MLDEPFPLEGVPTGEVVHRAVACLRALPEVRAAFLFGSRIYGEEDHLSDVDFALLLREGAGDLPVRSALIRALHTDDLGIAVLNQADDRFRRMVASLGQPIYEAEDGTVAGFLDAHRDPGYTRGVMERDRMDEYLERLGECIEALHEILAEGRDAAIDVLRNRYALERLIEVAAQIVIDVCRHTVRRLGLGTPDDARHTIEMVAEEGMFAEDLARRLSALPGLRNRLVHEYLRVDHEAVFAGLQQGLRDLEAFRAAMGGGAAAPPDAEER